MNGCTGTTWRGVSRVNGFLKITLTDMTGRPRSCNCWKWKWEKCCMVIAICCLGEPPPPIACPSIDRVRQHYFPFFWWWRYSSKIMSKRRRQNTIFRTPVTNIQSYFWQSGQCSALIVVPLRSRLLVSAIGHSIMKELPCLFEACNRTLSGMYWK